MGLNWRGDVWLKLLALGLAVATWFLVREMLHLQVS